MCTDLRRRDRRLNVVKLSQTFKVLLIASFAVAV